MVGDPVGEGDRGDSTDHCAEEDPEGDAIDSAACHVGGGECTVRREDGGLPSES